MMKSRLKKKVVLMCVMVFSLSLLMTWSALAVEKAKLTVWVSNSFYKRYIDVFNRDHPDIFVNFVHKPGIEKLLMTSIAGGTAPDLVRLWRTWVIAFGSRGALVPLNKYIESDKVDLNAYFPGAIGECEYQGKYYSLPFNTDVHPLYYNRTMFEEVGLDPNKPPKTWKELEEYARRLTVIENGVAKKLGFAPNLGNVSFVDFLWPAGGKLVSKDKKKIIFNDEAGLRTLEWLLNFTDNISGGIATVAAFKTAAQNPTTFETAWAMMNNQLAMSIEVATPLVTFAQYAPDLDFDVANPPIPEGGELITEMGGFGFCIPRDCPNPETAWKFVKWTASKEAQLKFSALGEPPLGGGGLTVRKDVSEHAPFYTLQPKWAKLVAMESFGRFWPTTPITGEMQTELKDMIDSVLYHKKSPKEALDYAAKKLQEALDEVYRR